MKESSCGELLEARDYSEWKKSVGRPSYQTNEQLGARFSGRWQKKQRCPKAVRNPAVTEALEIILNEYVRDITERADATRNTPRRNNG